MPIDNNFQHKSKFIIPSSIIPNNYENISGEKIILSVGGAEHNRALVYLVNKHRTKLKESRSIGFNGNSFDRNLLDKKEETFLMGLNGPVSGGNSKSFNERTIDSHNFSTGHYVELISFKVLGYRVLSVYGLSALASRIMLEYLTARSVKYKKGESLYKCFIGETLSNEHQYNDFCILFELKTPPLEMEKKIFEILNGEDTFTFLQRTKPDHNILIELLNYYDKNIIEK